MRFLRHPVAAMVLFAVLIGLLIPVYKALEEGYGITKGDVKTVVINSSGGTNTGNIMDALNSIQLVKGIEDLNAGLTKLKPGASIADIVGGLLSVGIGAARTVIGVLIGPYQIVNGIIFAYYPNELPAVLGGLFALITVYVVFILLSIYLRKDV